MYPQRKAESMLTKIGSKIKRLQPYCSKVLTESAHAPHPRIAGRRVATHPEFDLSKGMIFGLLVHIVYGFFCLFHPKEFIF